MALRDQPYLPLYVQDFLTDEKLIECSASATGVYIRLMCIMHKSDPYGTILLKQKDKQTSEQLKNFACKLAKQMPYSIAEIESSLVELIAEKVISIDGDLLSQCRMVRDNELSLKRSDAGSKGGKVAQAKVKAKSKANSEYENEYEIENRKVIPPTLESVRRYCALRKNDVNPEKWHDFYQSKDWKVGKNKMTDWQAAVRTWEEKKPAVVDMREVNLITSK